MAKCKRRHVGISGGIIARHLSNDSVSISNQRCGLSWRRKRQALRQKNDIVAASKAKSWRMAAAQHHGSSEISGENTSK